MKPSDFTFEIIDRHIKDEELKRLLITHSECVGRKAVELACKAGLDKEVDLQFLLDASMLHDIGVVECDAPSIHCHGTLPYICHGLAGKNILDSEGLDERYGRVCERHTGSGLTAKEIEEGGLPLPRRDLLPETIEEKLICYADKFYSKSGDPAVEKTAERVEASMKRHGEEAWQRFLKLQATIALET